jgi:alanine racemase
MPRPIEATIDLAALRANYRRAKAALPSHAFAVVKADAYGHGLERVAGALATLADGFALLDLDEAARLRALGLTQPILLLEGVFEPADLEAARVLQLSLVVHRREQFEWLERAGLLGELPLFVKFNTGMNRLGFSPADAAWLLPELARLPAGTATLMTHFSDADGATGIAEQLATFRRLAAGWTGPTCLANSAAVLRHPQVGGAWTRPGIMLYGGSPFAWGEQDWRAQALALRPAMTLQSRLIAVQSLLAGETVGYGRTFVAEHAMRVGVVACGYADGYPRHAPGGTPVLVSGVRTRLVGRVSMDMITVDLTPCPRAEVGDPVVLWGEGLPADEVATAAGTVSYELFCALARRVPVRVIGDGES